MTRLFVKYKIIIGSILPILALFYVVNWMVYGDRASGLLPLDVGMECAEEISKNQEENAQKIQSYTFPGISRDQLKDLGLSMGTMVDRKMPEYPAIVTALSSTHYLEGLQLVENVNTVVRKKYPKVLLIMFDIGLSTSQREEIKAKCNCDVRQFPFEQFPEHVRGLKTYTWKPLAVQLVAAEHPFVFWTDTSVRFKTSDLDPLFHQAKTAGVQAAVGFQFLAMSTTRGTFEFLHELPCTFRVKKEFEATFMTVYATPFVQRHFLYPWVACALVPGCMVPVPNHDRYLHCQYNGKAVYHFCHRYDQSVLSILLHRLYGNEAWEHKMDHTFYQICKGGDEAWFLPSVLNELVISAQQRCF